jgi:ABC-type transport system substrate-binding protein
MIRKRGATSKVAFIGALALSFGVAGTALATTEPPTSEAPAGSEAGGGGECPRDIAAAAAEEAAAETTAAPETAAPETTAAEAVETTAAPETTEAAPVETEPPATLPENVSELDANATISINPQPRENLQQGGELRISVGSLAENWNPAHPDGNEGDFSQTLQPMTYFPWNFDAEGTPQVNPDFLLDVQETEDPFTVTLTLNPEAHWHSGDPITVADWQAAWNSLNSLNP